MRMKAFSMVESKRLRPCANIRDSASCGVIALEASSGLHSPSKRLTKATMRAAGAHAVGGDALREAGAISVLVVLGNDEQQGLASAHLTGQAQRPW